MKADIIPVFDSITREQLEGKQAVVFDVLRATSTIITALANGCKEVVPVVTVDEALAYAEHHANVILGGERESLLIPGFHLGNSPLEYTSERVKGKTVVLTTTNGTNAIRRAAQGAARVIIASFLNARSVAKEVLKTGSDVVLICAGTRGKLSLEDIVAAGRVCRELARIAAGKEALVPGSDLVVAACRLADFYKEDPLPALKDSLHGQKLAALGFAEDLAFCSRLNSTEVTPVFRDGRIIVETG
ncbi:MAG: 2-phosphosulfolactate phosphatase [Peptococcaceae bacterium MAG4]|jgi:2-phosphosulfolactate phosphatase|nr:2-phosphosulfolactate phosphatase [Peptococcaceae bacterium MAG4]NLW39116.1 2-phosphosulfolactate phosphatase [Peptococcaceae bacterium]